MRCELFWCRFDVPEIFQMLNSLPFWYFLTCLIIEVYRVEAEELYLLTSSVKGRLFVQKFKKNPPFLLSQSLNAWLNCQFIYQEDYGYISTPLFEYVIISWQSGGHAWYPWTKLFSREQTFILWMFLFGLPFGECVLTSKADILCLMFNLS